MKEKQLLKLSSQKFIVHDPENLFGIRGDLKTQSDQQMVRFFKTFFNDCVDSVAKVINTRGFIQEVNLNEEYNQVVIDTIKKACENNYFLGKLLSTHTEQFNKEIAKQLKEAGGKVDVMLAAKKIAADVLYKQFANNEEVIGAKAVSRIIDEQIKEKLDLDEQAHLKVKETLSDTGMRFLSNELLDGDVTGETLFNKLDQGMAMTVLTDIKTGLMQDETVNRQVIDVADEIINDEFQKGHSLSLENGVAELEKSFTQRIKEVCEKRGVFFDYDNHKQHQQVFSKCLTTRMKKILGR